MVELPDSARGPSAPRGPLSGSSGPDTAWGRACLEHQQVSVGWSLLVLAAVPLWLWWRGERTSLASEVLPCCSSWPAPPSSARCLPSGRSGRSRRASRPRCCTRWPHVPRLCPVRHGGRSHGRAPRGSGVRLVSGIGPRPAGRRAAILLLGLAVLEFAPLPPWRWRDVLPTRAHRWLAGAARPLRALDCVPPSRWSDSLALSLLGHEASRLGTPPFDDCGEPRLGDKLEGDGLHPRRGAPGQQRRKVAGREPAARGARAWTRVRRRLVLG
jgi:hypothetical protein